MGEPIRLHFTENGMDRFDLYMIKVLGDGNCFFHAICRAYFNPYIEERLEGKVVSRVNIVKSLRRDISLYLNKKIDPGNSNSLTYYESLGKGNIAELGKTSEEYSLKRMEKHLDSNEQCGEEVHELVSVILQKNIFLIDMENEDVYVTTDINNLYDEKRNCVVLLYNMVDHFDTCGIMDSEGKCITHFKFDNPFIQFLYRRLKEKKGM